MEYLITYGWALTIIGVAAAALFYIVFYGGYNNVFSPKASPGSCIVYVTNQQGNLGLSTSMRNLEGACNNELPMYVAKFNGTSSFINIAHIGPLSSGTSYTVVLWMMGTSQNGALYSTGSSDGYQVFSHLGGAAIWTGGSGDLYSSKAIADGKWHQVAGVFNSSGTGAIYVDGAEVLSGSTSNIISSQSEQIGMQSGGGLFFNGSIANVQVYNTSLSSNAIMILYDEGIGGAPIALQWLAGWWPLNENANDYSGNNNNGVANNVVYTTSWASSYTAPP